MRIDAHQHFWKYSRTQYGWISDAMAPLQRDCLPNDLQPLLQEAGIDASIAVQARQSELETQWLLELAARHEFVCGVVGWIDLCAVDLKSRLGRYATSPWLKGFRHVLQDEADERFMLRPSFLQGMQQIARRGYTYDILVFSRQLPVVIEFLDRLPPMPLVIDHIAKPDIAEDEWQPWAEQLRVVASFPHVCCKLSGMVTQAARSHFRPNALTRYMDHVLEIFGPHRLLFGSDWPVCTLAASYRDVRGVVVKFLSNAAPEHADDILGDNAARFYSIVQRDRQLP